jgi:hypothetical protein
VTWWSEKVSQEMGILCREKGTRKQTKCKQATNEQSNKPTNKLVIQTNNRINEQTK